GLGEPLLPEAGVLVLHGREIPIDLGAPRVGLRFGHRLVPGCAVDLLLPVGAVPREVVGTFGAHRDSFERPGAVKSRWRALPTRPALAPRGLPGTHGAAPRRPRLRRWRLPRASPTRSARRRSRRRRERSSPEIGERPSAPRGPTPRG